MKQPEDRITPRVAWRKFRNLPTRVQVGVWVAVVLMIIAGSAVGSGGGARPLSTRTSGEVTTSTTTAPPDTTPATTIPVTLAPTTVVPETVTPTVTEPATTVAVPTTTTTPAATVPYSTAAALLATLPVGPAAPMAGYSREQFGPAWADVDHNGCDTRNDILNRDLTTKSWKAGTHDCVVMSGILSDPYTGGTIQFAKADAAAVQIDHVVSLADAWQTGAQTWSAAARERYANDPLDLLAVDRSSNESKGDSDASGWLPPNTAFRCPYVARQVQIKASYKLWVTPAEHDAMAAVLAACGAAPTSPSTTAAPTTTTAPPATAPPATGVYYPNCAAAEAAGAAPIRAGQPGYRPALDRDHDGVACES